MLYQHDAWQALSISVYGDWRQQQRKENWVYRRGDLYLANLGVPVGSKQGGVRPVVVLQNDVGNYYAPTITIAPLTPKIPQFRGFTERETSGNTPLSRRFLYLKFYRNSSSLMKDGATAKTCRRQIFLTLRPAALDRR